MLSRVVLPACFGLVWLAATPALALDAPSSEAPQNPDVDASVPPSELTPPANPDGADANASPPVDADADAGVADAPAEPPVEPEPTEVAEPVEEEVKGAENVEQIMTPQPGPCGDKPCPPVQKGPQQPVAPPRPLFMWVTAGWSDALGSAHCSEGRLPGTDLAIRIASTLKQAVGRAGVGLSAAGVLGDHPLIRYAARRQPEQLAQLFADAKFSAIALGVADLRGPVLDEIAFTNALATQGIPIVASNLVCHGQTFCASWSTAEDPPLILERDGRRFAFISVLPDDLLGRVEPAGGRNLELRSAAETLVDRTRQARAAGVALVVASIDHGPDASASVNLANFVAQLPRDGKPDLVLSPSAADSLLFLRPLEVSPAVVGTRGGALTSVRVNKIGDDDSDVLARVVRLGDPDPGFAALLEPLGASFCRDRGADLPGGQLEAPMTRDQLVELDAEAIRQLADADLVVLDPLVFDSTFTQPRSSRLQPGQVERAIELDSPLVVANVTLEWLANLNKVLTGLRPLALFGTGTERGDATIAGRYPVIGATYTIVTTAVLARSGRLPDGAAWSPLDERNATLGGALVAHLSVADPRDPRARLLDPRERTQWVFRADGQVQGNLTAVDNPSTDNYSDPALQVNDSRQLGARLLLNLDADAPRFLFENVLQLAFDRNFATKTTAQDLAFLQSTYTYRGLWPGPLLYPHPFAEAYAETTFTKGTSDVHHLLLRPKIGLRSIFSRVLSFKLSAGAQYEVFGDDQRWHPGIGAELVCKPWTIPLSNGSILQLEGNVTYFWNGPGTADEHTLRGQVISGLQIVGPLQFTLTALGVYQKDPGVKHAQGLGIQAGVRLRYVERMIGD